MKKEIKEKEDDFFSDISEFGDMCGVKFYVDIPKENIYKVIALYENKDIKNYDTWESIHELCGTLLKELVIYSKWDCEYNPMNDSACHFDVIESIFSMKFEEAIRAIYEAIINLNKEKNV